MAVDPAVSRAHVEKELNDAKPIIEFFGWTHDWQPDKLLLRAEITAPDGEKYVYEFFFDDYRQYPPLIDAVHFDSGARNQANCYPTGGFGYFHGSNVICAPWSRRSYSKLFEGAPHSDWDISNWPNTVPGGQTHPPKKYVGDFLAALAQTLKDPNYKGRRS